MVVNASAHELPLVSVVITCYNQAAFLSDAIESVLQQNYPHQEVVIIDDGSTDDTPQVIARYPRFNYIRKENQGVVAARNDGLRESKGDYVVFLDGDDRLLPNAVRTGVQKLNAHTECAFVYGRCVLIAADGSPLPTWQHPDVESEHYLVLLHHNFIWMPAQVMYRRSAIESVEGFRPGADHCSDYDLYLRISSKFSICGHNDVVAEWRQHQSNTSHKIGMMLESILKALEAQRDFVRNDKRYEEALKAGIKYYQKSYGGKLIDHMLTSFKTRQWKRLAQETRLLLRHYPQGLIVKPGWNIYRKIAKLENN